MDTPTTDNNNNNNNNIQASAPKRDNEWNKAKDKNTHSLTI